MSLGCPVVAAPCGALPETCGDAALYIDPDDVAGWANAVRKLADDPVQRSLLAERGRAQSASYTWAASAGKLLDVLLEVCEGWRAHPEPTVIAEDIPRHPCSGAGMGSGI
jgi:glycosyltransferase involved in cell wall biosynthesis